MTTHIHTHTVHDSGQLIRGQRVVVRGNGAEATVVDHPNEDRVRVTYTDGSCAVFWRDEVRTRAEQLHHSWNAIRRIAQQIGDQVLEDILECAAADVVRAGEQCDAADAVRGLGA